MCYSPCDLRFLRTWYRLAHHERNPIHAGRLAPRQAPRQRPARSQLGRAQASAAGLACGDGSERVRLRSASPLRPLRALRVQGDECMPAAQRSARRKAPLRAKPKINRASQSATSGDVDLDPVALASLTLQSICRDVEAPAAARAQSARTLLELAGVLKTGAQNAQKLGAEMTLAEIDERLAGIAPDTGADTR